MVLECVDLVFITSQYIVLVYYREENDVDEQLSGRLYDRVDGLEKASILNKINYNKQYDIDSTDLYKRLKEIEEEEAALKAK